MVSHHNRFFLNLAQRATVSLRRRITHPFRWILLMSTRPPAEWLAPTRPMPSVEPSDAWASPMIVSIGWLRRMEFWPKISNRFKNKIFVLILFFSFLFNIIFTLYIPDGFCWLDLGYFSVPSELHQRPVPRGLPNSKFVSNLQMSLRDFCFGCSSLLCRIWFDS